MLLAEVHQPLIESTQLRNYTTAELTPVGFEPDNSAFAGLRDLQFHYGVILSDKKTDGPFTIEAFLQHVC